MLASDPVPTLNQISADLGIPNRFSEKSSRTSGDSNAERAEYQIDRQRSVTGQKG